ARIVVDISDTRGLHSVTATAESGSAPSIGGFSAETTRASFSLAAPVNGLAQGGLVTFDLDVVLRGSGSLQITPLGESTRFELQSDWPHPSFMGSWLPVEWAYVEPGFHAVWETSHFSRPFPQYWTDQGAETDRTIEILKTTTLGDGFIQPVDGYRLVERACKYGILFFVPTFTAFFLFE